MAWMTEDQFRKIYVTDSATELVSEQVEDCLDSAFSQIAKKVSSQVVSDVSLETPTDVARAKDIRRAQGKLAYADLLLIESSRYRSGGILSQEKDANSSATDTYESFSAIEKRRSVLKSDAFELLEPYYSTVIAEEIESTDEYTMSVDVLGGW